jgi:ABC-2 type transport system permease protein
LLKPSSDHPITRNLNRVKGEFVNYIDTVGLDHEIRKKILLSSSQFSRTISPPVIISLKEAELTPSAKDFNKSNLPVAVLLEGFFPSAFKNRPVANLTEDRNLKIRTESLETRMIVIADADMIRNGVKRSGLNETPLPLGQDKYTGQIYGNRDFLINCLNWLVDRNGLMELRSRELKLRLLNNQMIKSERLKWQIINVAGPVIIVILAGLLYSYLRRRKYAKY